MNCGTIEQSSHFRIHVHAVDQILTFHQPIFVRVQTLEDLFQHFELIVRQLESCFNILLGLSPQLIRIDQFDLLVLEHSLNAQKFQALLLLQNAFPFRREGIQVRVEPFLVDAEVLTDDFLCHAEFEQLFLGYHPVTIGIENLEDVFHYVAVVLAQHNFLEAVFFLQKLKTILLFCLFHVCCINFCIFHCFWRIAQRKKPSFGFATRFFNRSFLALTFIGFLFVLVPAWLNQYLFDCAIDALLS